MSFDTFWQMHRRFLTGIAIGLVVFLIGKAIIGSTVGADLASARARIRGARTELQKPAYGSGDVARLEGRLAELEERTITLAGLTLPALPPDYRPAEGASAAQHYIEWTGSRRQQLIRNALLSNVTVDETLGLPPMSPTDPQVIERVLRGFFVVDSLVELSVDFGAVAVEDVEISTRALKRRVKGMPPSPLDTAPVTMEVLLPEERVAGFAGALFAHDPPLGLVSFELLAPDRRHENLRRLSIECEPGVVPAGALGGGEEELG